MKHPLLFLLFLIITYAVLCAVGVVITIWLVLSHPITFQQVIHYSKIGVLGGGWIGAGIWFSYYLKCRKNLK